MTAIAIAGGDRVDGWLPKAWKTLNQKTDLAPEKLGMMEQDPYTEVNRTLWDISVKWSWKKQTTITGGNYWGMSGRREMWTSHCKTLLRHLLKSWIWLFSPVYMQRDFVLEHIKRVTIITLQAWQQNLQLRAKGTHNLYSLAMWGFTFFHLLSFYLILCLLLFFV